MAKKARIKTKIRYVRAKVRRARARARGLGIKGLSVKDMIAGTVGLIVAQRYQPFGGQYKGAVDKVATGLVLNVAKLDNKDLITAGIKEGLATLANSYLSGGGLGLSLGSTTTTGEAL